MTNNYHRRIILIIGLLSTACHKDLNVFPTDADANGNLITDQTSAQLVLNGVYYRFAFGGADEAGVVSTRWTDINEHFPSELAGSSINSGNYDDSVSNLSFSPGLPAIDSIWVYGYDLVNAASGFIKNASPVSNIPAAAKQQMMAEASFLRAFGNSELLFYFGQYHDPTSTYGIILRDTFTTAANVVLSRSGVAAAYTSILADLDVAIKGLPALNSAICYANASDAKLLEARVLLNRGAAGDYAQVVTLANDIITNGPFTLEDSVKDIFLTKGFASSEVMLAIQPYPSEDYKWYNYVLNHDWEATDSFMSLLANAGRNQWVYQTVTPFFSPPVSEWTKYYTGNPNNPVMASLSTNSYAFRLSEAYLLEAEAITLSTGDLATAKTLLTTVMTHAGAGVQELAMVDGVTTPSALQLEIVKEYLRNFVVENGADWLALRRLPFATIQVLNPNIKRVNQLILPIPSAELTENNIIQNPGY